MNMEIILNETVSASILPHPTLNVVTCMETHCYNVAVRAPFGVLPHMLLVLLQGCCDTRGTVCNSLRSFRLSFYSAPCKILMNPYNFCHCFLTHEKEYLLN